MLQIPFTMTSFFFRTAPVALLGLMASGCAQQALAAGAIPTKIVKTGDKFQLMRDGKPYLIKGAGGGGPLDLLKERGGNSNRTWGSDNIGGKLDEAQKLGLTYTVGIWLGHTEHGFDYSDDKAVAAQFEKAKAAIDKYKDHPAVLAWGIGNEMEGYKGETDPKMWAAVQQIAAYAHKVDPNHPTMTVIAEIGGDKVASINKFCPDIDIVGINSYGGAPSIAERYPKAGGVKPYVLTEFGPPGTWEIGKTDWGAAFEPTSSAKADSYATIWNKAIANQPLALGGYAFTWGNKQEATATWFGMLLPDGEILGAVDALSQIWTGKAPAESAPVIESYKLQGADKVKPGALVNADLKVSDPDGDPIQVEWILRGDLMIKGSNGDAQPAPPDYPNAVIKSDNNGAQIKMPQFGGAYRLFAYARDGKNGAAVANVPLFVEGGDKAPATKARAEKLPFDLTPEDGVAPYIASGYMGNTGAISMENSTDDPHSGKDRLKVQYKAADNWGGVVWQSPANDWGDKPGGYDLSGAKKLTFWARGAKGGEKIGFGFGLIGNDKKYYDTTKGKTTETLTSDWKQYEIPIGDVDLSRIKTGFYWTAAGAGAPITFYLDDIKYE